MKTGILKTGAAERRELILNGSIVRTLMMLSFPTLMMSVVQSLMPLSDGLFINNVAGTLVASAVTYSEPIINMMTALAQGLSVAAMAIIGQTFGQGNFKRVKHSDRGFRILPRPVHRAASGSHRVSNIGPCGSGNLS